MPSTPMLLVLALGEVQERLCESSVRALGTKSEYSLNSWVACASMADCAEVPASRVAEIISELKAEGVEQGTSDISL